MQGKRADFSGDLGNTSVGLITVKATGPSSGQHEVGAALQLPQESERRSRPLSSHEEHRTRPRATARPTNVEDEFQPRLRT
jgi:hypothetical protein